MKKFSKVDTAIKVNISSIWIIYMYDWLFTPDDADIAASNGYDLGVRGGEAFKTESRAIWHGKRWMKECGRTGTITAIPAIYPEPYHIIEW